MLLACTGVLTFVVALIVRHDKTSSTLALVLAGLAGLLVVLALLLPYLAGLSASAAGVSLGLSFAAARPEGVATDQIGSLRGQYDPVSRYVAVPETGQTAFADAVRGDDVEYAVINLGQGNRWLTSRLLIFTVVMRELRQMRCVVLTAATGTDGRERLLGLTASEDVHRALAWEYPWLEVALFTAWQALPTPPVAVVVHEPPAAVAPALEPPQVASAGIPAASLPASPAAQPIRIANLDANRAEYLFTKYRDLLHAPEETRGADVDEWTAVQYGGSEHAQLLSAEGIRRLLGGSLDTRRVRRSRSRSKQLAAVLAIDAPYVAIVDDDDRFLSLVDRQALLEELGRQASLRYERPSDIS